MHYIYFNLHPVYFFLMVEAKNSTNNPYLLLNKQL
jgi:hypothetical protein